MSVQGSECGGGTAVMSFAGELDAGDSGFGDDLLAGAAETPRLVVDLLNVSFIDSSVVRALLLAHRSASAEGGWVRVVYTHHLVRRVIEMCGLSELFPQYPSVEAARRGVAALPPSSESQEGGK